MQKIPKNSQKQFMELIHGAIIESYYFTQPNSFQGVICVPRWVLLLV